MLPSQKYTLPLLRVLTQLQTMTVIADSSLDGPVFGSEDTVSIAAKKIWIY